MLTIRRSVVELSIGSRLGLFSDESLSNKKSLSDFIHDLLRKL